MIERKKKIIKKLNDRIDKWIKFDETLHGYKKKDAINFLKRFCVGVYDNVLKNIYWFGYNIDTDTLVRWDIDRKKYNTLNNITEENYIVYTELSAIKNHIERINEYPKTYKSFYKTRYSYKNQTPTTKEEQKELEKLYKDVLSKNYNWRQAREVVTAVNKLNMYEDDKFPHNIDKIKACFSSKVKVHFPDFFEHGSCYFDTIDVEKKALELAKELTEENLPDLFSTPSKTHIEEYLRRMILSQYDIPLLVHNRNSLLLKDNLSIVRQELSESTTLSDEARKILFKNANKKELLDLSKGVLLSLSHHRQQLNIFDTCNEFQKILNCNYGTVYYNDINHLTLPNKEVIYSTPYEDIKKQYATFQKKYEFFYQNATDLEYVEGCTEILGNVLMSQIFREGNKRTAKCLFNQMLISRGILPPVIDLNENESELWNDFAYSRKDRFDLAIPKVLQKTITEAEQFRNKKYSTPLIVSENAHKRDSFNDYSY